MCAIEFVTIERKDLKVYENIADYLFGSQKVALMYALDKTGENSYAD